MILQLLSHPLRIFTESGFAPRWMYGRAAVLALVVLFLGAHLAVAKEHKYVGVKKCKTCHKREPIGNQYAAWMNSKHARAYETLTSEKARSWARDAGIDDPQTDDECLKCHSTASGVPEDLLSGKFKRGGGVGCEACHGPGKDYRKNKVMIDRELAISKGMILPRSEKVCVSCHNDESRGWDSERYTRADGTKTGFDYDKAQALIAHPIPDDYDPEADEDDED